MNRFVGQEPDEANRGSQPDWKKRYSEKLTIHA